jgi:hypothetical protein
MVVFSIAIGSGWLAILPTVATPAFVIVTSPESDFGAHAVPD